MIRSLLVFSALCSSLTLRERRRNVVRRWSYSFFFFSLSGSLAKDASFFLLSFLASLSNRASFAHPNTLRCVSIPQCRGGKFSLTIVRQISRLIAHIWQPLMEKCARSNYVSVISLFASWPMSHLHCEPAEFPKISGYERSGQRIRIAG